MKPQRTRGARGGPPPDIHPPDCQTHKHAENFFDKKQSDQGSSPRTKRGSTLVGDLMMPPLTAKTRATAEGGSNKGCFCKPLTTRFRRGGFDYRQIARERSTATYEQRWTGCAEASVCYEVIRIRSRDGFQIGGRFVEAAKVYPNSEAWGVDGFTFTDRDAAFAKLREMA